MVLGLSILMASMNSDSEILEFLKEVDYDSEACDAAILSMKDPAVLDELVKKIENKACT